MNCRQLINYDKLLLKNLEVLKGTCDNCKKKLIKDFTKKFLKQQYKLQQEINQNYQNFKKYNENFKQIEWVNNSKISILEFAESNLSRYEDFQEFIKNLIEVIEDEEDNAKAYIKKLKGAKND